MTETKQADMFVKSRDRSSWLNRMRRDPRVSHFAFRLGYMLAQDADDNGTFSQKMVELAGRAGVHLPTLVGGLERLAGLGYISFERGGNRQPTHITIRPIVSANRDGRRPARDVA